MRHPEQRLWDWLNQRLGHRGMLERVENEVKRDTPDLYIALPGQCGWAELKALEDWPRRAATPVRLPGWTVGQRHWMQRLNAAGASGWLIVQIGGDIAVFNAARVSGAIDTWDQAQWRSEGVVLVKRDCTTDGLIDALQEAMV